MAGDVTSFAASNETGRGRDRVGIEKLRANDAKDGKLEEDKEPECWGDATGEDRRSFIGVVDGGGFDSELCHASLAASSSELASGSN